MNEIESLNKKFETTQPQEILKWALSTYKEKSGISSSFGGTSAALIHMAIQIDPSVPILFYDTGFLFKQTVEFKDELKKRLKLNVREFRATPEQIETTRRNLLTKDKTGICCDNSKIDLAKRSLEGLSCWIVGLQRTQSKTRKSIKIIEEQGAGLVKVHPLANWTSKEIYAYMKQHDLPFHPLWEKGYKSIGCEPCTSLPLPGQDDRSGRWAGLDKTECGIHTFMSTPNQGEVNE